MQPSQPPRFGRVSTSAVAPSAPVARPVASPVGSAAPDGDLMQRYRQLKTHGDQLQQRRARRQFELEQADAVVTECQQQALGEFQVDSLDELDTFIATQVARDQAALDAYETALRTEAALQQSVDDRMLVLDRPTSV